MGDDLTELILQYLTFEDKVRLECVSKQWRRLVFNKQFVIEIINRRLQQTKDSLRSLNQNNEPNMESINRRALESVLHKCHYIQTIRIDIEVSSEVLSLIGRYCHRIKSLKYTFSSISGDNFLPFFRMYGHKLEELEFQESWDENSDEIKPILKFCSNVERIYFYGLEQYLNQDKEFLPKLKHIKSPFEIKAEYSWKLKILSDKYSQTLKILHVSLSELTEEELKICIECIARFENLKELKIKLRLIGSYDSEPIDDCLSLIGQKCNKLLKLDLIINNNVPISDTFLDIFSLFKAIKKLKINITENTVLSGSVECFKHCTELIDLEIYYNQLTEDFFENIALFVPKLKFLQFSTSGNLPKSFINSFHSMKSIEKVILLRYYQTVWYFGKCLSNEMSGPKAKDIIRVNDSCGYIRRFHINESLLIE